MKTIFDEQWERIKAILEEEIRNGNIWQSKEDYIDKVGNYYKLGLKTGYKMGEDAVLLEMDEAIGQAKEDSKEQIWPVIIW